MMLNNVFAQECKYEKNEIDERTLLSVKRTVEKELCQVNRYPFTVKAQAINDRKYLKARYYRYNDFYIPTDQALIFVFDDHSLLSLTPLQPKSEKKTSDGFTKVSSLLVFPLNEKNFNILLEKPVIQVKYFHNNTYIIEDIKKRDQTIVSDLLKCIQ